MKSISGLPEQTSRHVTFKKALLQRKQHYSAIFLKDFAIVHNISTVNLNLLGQVIKNLQLYFVLLFKRI